MSDRNVIERLCELLDERGVEYETDERNAITKWSTYYGAFVFFARQREGKLLVETTVATKHSVILTPEQAVAVTLRSGTCKNIAPDYLDFLCSKCGFVHYHSDENDTGDGNDWNFCPNCGKRVTS